MGDQEAFQFAVQLKTALERAGWTVDGVNQGVYTNPINGLIVSVRNEPAPSSANQLFVVLRAVGFPPTGSLNPKQPENSAWLVVGSKP